MSNYVQVARLNNVSEACADIGTGDAALRQEFRQFIDASDKNRDAAANEMAVTVLAGGDAKAILRDKFATDFCGAAAKRQLLDKLKATVGS